MFSKPNNKVSLDDRRLIVGENESLESGMGCPGNSFIAKTLFSVRTCEEFAISAAGHAQITRVKRSVSLSKVDQTHSKAKGFSNRAGWEEHGNRFRPTLEKINDVYIAIRNNQTLTFFNRYTLVD